MKFIKPFLFCALLFLSATAHGTTLYVNEVLDYMVGGDEMEGIEVTVYYEGADSETAIWDGTTSSAVGSDWVLNFASGHLNDNPSQPLVDDTYWGLWSFFSTSAKGIESLYIDAFIANILIDKIDTPELTPGSEYGWSTSDLATFINPVALSGSLPFGDLFGAVSFDLSNTDVKTSAYTFGLDTDAFEPVPEPGTLLLLGIGLFGLAGMIRRKKKV